MRGVVSGSPYGASAGQMAVPVLFSKQTARDAGLRSPVGVIIVKRTAKVKLPGGGTTSPVNLRTGDRFKGVGEVNALQRKVFYARIPFSKPSVYFRSKELSLAEISAAIDALRNALLGLQADLNAFKGATIAAFQSLLNQIADLQKQLAALQAVKLPDFQAQLDALNKRLNDLVASLPDFGKFALLSQLPDLTGYAKLTDVTNMIGAAIAGLNLAQYAQASVVATLQTTVGTLQTQVTTLTSRLNAVCTSLKAATVDPDGVGALPPVPVTLPGITAAGACGP
jgi:uncharacterized coiled-coil protein SlyX